MPRVTIWIRNDDYDKWLAIADKPAWLHEHLNGGLVTYTQAGKSVSIHVPKFPEPTTDPFDPSP